MTTEIQAPEGGERAAFEVWARSNHLIGSSGRLSPSGQIAWDAWQARAALAAQPQAAPVAPLSERAILDLVPSTMPIANDFDLLWFARAVERAHGIQANKEPNHDR